MPFLYAAFRLPIANLEDRLGVITQLIPLVLKESMAAMRFLVKLNYVVEQVEAPKDKEKDPGR